MQLQLSNLWHREILMLETNSFDFNRLEKRIIENEEIPIML